MVEIEYVALGISVAFNVVTTSIAVYSLWQVKNSNDRIRLADELSMYADIGYGYGSQTNHYRWDNMSDTLLINWFERFYSYNGKVDVEIQEKYEFVVKHCIEKPKDEKVMNELKKKRKEIVEHARIKVKELGGIIREL